MIRSPTYTTGSLLDVCIVKRPNSVLRAYVRVRFCHLSPHVFLRTFIRTSKPHFKQYTVQIRSVNKINLSLFYADLRYVNWAPIFNAQSVSDQWRIFLCMFLPVLDRHAPVKTVTISNPTAPPVSRDTSDRMARRRGALKTWGHGSTEYRQLSRDVRSAIRRDTRAHRRRNVFESGEARLSQAPPRAFEAKS